LIDRPIRPLFPEGFINDVQVVASVLSVNSEVDPDIASLIGASAALAISGMRSWGPSARPAWASPTASTSSTRPRRSWRNPSSTWWSPAPRKAC